MVEHLTQKFPGRPLNSRFPGFPGGFLNSSRFPGFPGVVDTLKSCVDADGGYFEHMPKIN